MSRPNTGLALKGLFGAAVAPVLVLSQQAFEGKSWLQNCHAEPAAAAKHLGSGYPLPPQILRGVYSERSRRAQDDTRKFKLTEYQYSEHHSDQLKGSGSVKDRVLCQPPHNWRRATPIGQGEVGHF